MRGSDRAAGRQEGSQGRRGRARRLRHAPEPRGVWSGEHTLTRHTPGQASLARTHAADASARHACKQACPPPGSTRGASALIAARLSLLHSHAWRTVP